MPDPYQAGLALLARRELSTAQVRVRLARQGFGPDAIEAALARLRRAGALDDLRTARALAHRSASVRLHGRRRAVQELQSRGIERSLALNTVEAVYRELDEHDLIERALARRLRGPIDSPAALRRLYQYLVRQGFGGAAAQAALRPHAAPQAFGGDGREGRGRRGGL